MFREESFKNLHICYAQSKKKTSNKFVLSYDKAKSVIVIIYFCIPIKAVFLELFLFIFIKETN